MGEVTGIVVAAGILSLDTIWVAVITFALAYIAGFALTLGPLLQDGVQLRRTKAPHPPSRGNVSTAPGVGSAPAGENAMLTDALTIAGHALAMMAAIILAARVFGL